MDPGVGGEDLPNTCTSSAAAEEAGIYNTPQSEIENMRKNGGLLVDLIAHSPLWLVIENTSSSGY